MWLRAHPWVGDSLLALVLFLFDLASKRGSQYDPVTETFVQVVSASDYILGSFLLVGPLVIRRKRPVLAAYVTLFGGIFVLVTHGPFAARMGAFALAIMLYTLLTHATRRVAAAYAAWLLLGTLLFSIAMAREYGLATAPFTVFFPVLIFAVFWMTGEFVGARRAYHAEVEQRLRMLEHERDQQAKIAVVEERNRIARELHDVVAHAVSVMIVQADGASYALKTSPETAGRALATISDTGRKALGELRRLVGVLRNDSEGNAEYAPQPDASALGELAEKMRQVGLPVRLTMTGDLSDLPTGVGLTVFRLVQEALTNTLKHAGPGASAQVVVTRAEDGVEVEIVDDGLGTANGSLVSGGNGLIGMRERVAVYHGTLEAGPRPGGGWRVRAVLPLSRESAT
ncbi:Signal transduction histidine kinase [Streptoalloteichus tenebrarius]|uniref:histidine kinase n=1 Tax=Streptoalloteichus tenebrarius (strain ATCC 17920 / DSM 40477 / JCM 4838 / CBS 697.72 / NBRC 16177 / NCIMB 11028 / NRRL B-12390 / A12253. 1 / ISP 5477) TaxID=1933 RepID=A0ABT1I2H0_STRSD|nr:Signal transduction histidine kinase [Streptoalloteichus tenebrarius]BFF02067.1 sensor histidine kinase [Streptoalloteichus tenebrarius]